MHFSGCYCLSGLFRCWATLVSFMVDLFSEQLRHLRQWHVVVHFHIYKTLCAVSEMSSAMVIRHCKCEQHLIGSSAVDHRGYRDKLLLYPVDWPVSSVTNNLLRAEGGTMNICTCERCRPHFPSHFGAWLLFCCGFSCFCRYRGV